MELTSYLMGKKAGGGGDTPTGTININDNGTYDVTSYASADVNVQPDLESKSVTITSNTTTTITPSQGKDGLSSVEVTTNVPKPILPNGLLFRSTIITDMDWLTDCDTSNLTSVSQMFQDMSAVQRIPTFDTSNVTNFTYCFKNCRQLTTLGLLNTSKVTTMDDAFSNCTNLNNDSLNNILLMCANSRITGYYAKLLFIGLTSSQATTCTTLSNYQTFLDAGWTTGY